MTEMVRVVKFDSFCCVFLVRNVGYIFVLLSDVILHVTKDLESI